MTATYSITHNAEMVGGRDDQMSQRSEKFELLSESDWRAWIIIIKGMYIARQVVAIVVVI